jgi:hypothetical protein
VDRWSYVQCRERRAHRTQASHSQARWNNQLQGNIFSSLYHSPNLKGSPQITSKGASLEGKSASRETEAVVFVESVGPFLHFTVDFDFVVQRLSPHPLNLDKYGHVAFALGPLVYCAETVDNPDVPDLRAIRISADAPVREVVDTESFAPWGMINVVVLKLPAFVIGSDMKVELTLIPLFLWANRGKADLRVWLPVS